MKKSILVCLGAVLAMSLVSCGNPSGSEEHGTGGIPGGYEGGSPTSYTITFTSVAPDTGVGFWIGASDRDALNFIESHDYPSSVPSPITSAAESTISAKDLPVLAQTGWKFLGWEKDGYLLEENDLVYMNQNVTLNAKWDFAYTTGWIVYKNSENKLVIAGNYSADIGTPYGILVMAETPSGSTLTPWIMSLEESDNIGLAEIPAFINTLPAGDKPWSLASNEVLDEISSGNAFAAMDAAIAELKAADPSIQELSGTYWTNHYRNNNSDTGIISVWKISPLMRTFEEDTGSFKVRGFRLFK